MQNLIVLEFNFVAFDERSASYVQVQEMSDTKKHVYVPWISLGLSVNSSFHACGCFDKEELVDQNLRKMKTHEQLACQWA